MKKHILLPFVLGLGLLFFTNSAKSQNFQIVASFGTAHNWAVPNAVLYEIDYYYPYHQIVHINRERRGRNIFYNVLLEDRGQFVEVFFGRQALILDINYYRNYPLAQHICSGHCGYHGNFYRNHRVVCNHRGHGHGHHRGHNHIAYRSGRNYNTYAAKSSVSNRNVRSSHVSHNRNNNVTRQINNRSSKNDRSFNSQRSATSRNSAERGNSSVSKSSRRTVEVRADNNRGNSAVEKRSSSNARNSRSGVSSTSSRTRNK
ncbi:hypothetical protein SAMN05661096_03310 [Marivirga sericea]|uniref:Uncharacterized protein n=1 Tax=Marivirga sericea TaxID=1028 RepID=A0A1X7KZI8_9BACT|nr:hypothetical protein [Marivirga sericea]SMG46820.1 hypothetical protein SAMN05661096_03310 [Marivirga sericea]